MVRQGGFRPFCFCHNLLRLATALLQTHKGRWLDMVDKDRVNTPHVEGYHQTQLSRCQSQSQCPAARVRLCQKLGGCRTQSDLSSLSLPVHPSLCPQCFSRIMALSWGRKSAVPPVSSPARQDRCKVGGQRKNQGINSSIQNTGADPAVPMSKWGQMIGGKTGGDWRRSARRPAVADSWVGVCVKGYFKIDGWQWERLWSR